MTGFRFHAAPPSPALAPFVEVIWGVEGEPPHPREAVLPNGAMELMVNFGPVQKVWGYGHRAVDEDFRRYWLAGIQDEPLVIGSPTGCDHLGIRFRPGGAHAFFRMPMDEVKGQVLDLDLLVGRGLAEDLRDRLAAAPDHDTRARVAEAWLFRIRYAVHPYFSTVRRALDLIQATGFRTSVGDLCERLGLSNRHLIAQFRAVVGLTPKAASRVVRFNAVVQATRGHDRVEWSALAHRFNYADQSHLAREFRHFAGVTPTSFLARRTLDETHVAVD